MSNPRTLTVLHDGGDIVVGALAGAVNPVVVLNDMLMAELLLDLRAAQAQALGVKSTVDATAFIKLCETLGRVVETYVVNRNKYFCGVSEPVHCANLVSEIERLQDEFNSLLPGRQ
ncbi:MAG: hypothetical protein LH481_06790 [Burkholderiales bacterium]|nr:hypothetical protein [Burkholderiales bacterium]